MTASMSKAQAQAAIREGVRKSIFLRELKQEDFATWTIKKIRDELKDALGEEVPNESQRLLMMNVAMRRECRVKKGWIVEVPSTGWYTKGDRQNKASEAIIDYVLSKPMKEA